ncbi:hypothetical protein J31TS6_62580 [Brevibacillus reuszeri]|nr:hypothetical protein J31TS6_62580 [Brevibacillus reuszeri]
MIIVQVRNVHSLRYNMARTVLSSEWSASITQSANLVHGQSFRSGGFVFSQIIYTQKKGTFNLQE